ncbi:MAG TPA: PQQ-binding-like beta-propeller repeat protein [Tepidisphaeraceae bacterium]|jgi:hypothetical protein
MRNWGFLVAIVLIGVSSAARGDEWTMYQHDVAHTGRSTASFDPRTITRSWSAPAGYATPLIVGGDVIAMRNQQGVGSDSTSIRSFRLSDGAVNWTYTGKYIFPSQPSYADGLVVYQAEEQGTNAQKLFVLDAATGALKYTVASLSNIANAPTLYHNPSTGKLTAYVSNGGNVQAIQLDATSGTVLWTKSGSIGGASIPTVAGSSVVLAGPGQYYSFDINTGASNHFQSGNISGGGGTTVAYDPSRSQFYVMEDYNGATTALTAYHYTSNSTITQVWQKTGAGVDSGASVALGADGKIYSVDNSTLVERDPDTGNILRSLGGQTFANAVTPALTDGYLWAFGQNDTYVYDLASFTKVKTLPGSRGSLNSSYDAPGSFDDGHFLLDYGTIYNSPGFDVYVAAPEPGMGMLVLAGIVPLLRRRR